MNSKEVFKFAVHVVPQSIEAALAKTCAGLTLSGIDWLLIHQANRRIIDAVVSRMDSTPPPPVKVISDLENYGNAEHQCCFYSLALHEGMRLFRPERLKLVIMCYCRCCWPYSSAGLGSGRTRFGP
ncbi:unnamed protein product [Cuscuta epithymum]|uniref:Beta-ketoacyl-[acyl-carrier-protein] synthase III C-terminal domain-containing protein n=1 Tax=Cuscuta epithymum TaxID=186058 RepID=A0AAV0F8C7_9ASTE|nr:unnamed protein product [Cuscuta epithymum]